VVKLPKSGGVVARDSKGREKWRERKIRQYFNGVRSDLSPQQKNIPANDVVIYQIGGGPQAPLSALPIGAQSTHDPLRLSIFSPSPSMCFSLMAISFAKSPNDVLKENVAGFLYVTAIEPPKIMFLCPCSDPWPSKYLIMGSLKYLE
jgi:polyribonucleotide 5'-hydroxyl-kinase